MAKRERKVHKQDDYSYLVKRAKCGARNPALSEAWSGVTCGTCLSWLPVNEREPVPEQEAG